MRALIIGKSGQVASELVKATPSGTTSLACGRDEINLNCVASIASVVENFQPDVIINAAAYTQVDKAESDKENAFALNRDAVRNLASVAKEKGLRFIHISTDFVFDGVKNTPYVQTDKPNPINVYGASKLAGEQEISALSDGNMAIVRTSWVYSCYGNNFVKTMLRLMAEKASLSIVCDQIGCPTNAKGLAAFIWQLSRQDQVNEIYHYSDLGVTTWYDFAVNIQEIAYECKLLDKKIDIYPILSSDYPTAARRPSYSVMQLSKNEHSDYWRSQLKNMIREVAL